MNSKRLLLLPVMVAGFTAALSCFSPVLAQSGAALQHRVVVAPATGAVQGGVLVAKEYQGQAERVVVHSKITQGAPYSAETATEFVHVLADGNRIVRRTTTRVYRDGEGRTRTETVGNDGAITSIRISDPVSGQSWLLDPETRTARRTTGVFTYTFQEHATAATGVTTGAKMVVVEPKTVPPASGAVPPPPPPPPPPPAAAGGRGGVSGGVATVTAVGAGGVQGGLVWVAQAGEQTKEDLGTQSIEGIVATGTRKITVIEAGSIGNEQPIKVVSEEWTSPDLGVLVLTRHSDPRTGETTFRLTNVLRAEPDPSLFVVPPDYTVKESMIKRELR